MSAPRPRLAYAGNVLLVEKANHLHVHALFFGLETAERHLREVIPDYCARGIFMDKTLTPESFEIVDRRSP